MRSRTCSRKAISGCCQPGFQLTWWHAFRTHRTCVCAAYRFGRFDRETANRIEQGEERRFRAPSPTTTSRRGVARYYAILRANRSDFAKDKDVAAKAAWTKEYLTYLCLVKGERVKDESETYGADTVSRRFRTLAETKAYYAGSGIPLPVQI